MDPSDELLDSLRSLIREEVRADPGLGGPPREDERPPRRAVIALLIASVNVALILTITEELWKDSSFIRFVGKLVPFLFGAVFVALLEDVRKQLLKICEKRSFRGAMVGVLLLLGLVDVFATIPAHVPVRMAEGTELMVDSVVRITEGDKRHLVDLVGFHHHVFIASHRIPSRPRPVTSTIEIGPWRRLRAIRFVRLWLPPDTIDASNLFPLPIILPDTLETPLKIGIRSVMHRSVRMRVQRQNAVDSFRVIGQPHPFTDPLEAVWLTVRLSPESSGGAFYLPDSAIPVSVSLQLGECSPGDPIPLTIHPDDNLHTFDTPLSNLRPCHGLPPSAPK